ncbi:MAG: rRNA maturation RNase YbeY [Hoeflea sp.]|uniref:rRNA maturation RNase YbeY n=1 Tax=Hoeflea sp. TaxID=1940281 RepID=UPI001E15114A|nr:rRNA maturation RNase YbeY [Hoeflea sp.]MBU4531527.1 rRNA maturation RNase YbeY [Alphaproteobacteria bacterium]MBU4544384.1 rRNA maturation RNase YbeY [Alphaproteobacteria bacterium]MBU4550379.1 rRNA maturation RNase YbeY [Alphaproteobacteria bacterium]MBV1724803.1 rRNA maturation RNase YbeY [Hoeflea sp.]MBV1760823.1 rRNA maturation RNase YbeY [Hoeflea sp.]
MTGHPAITLAVAVEAGEWGDVEAIEELALAALDAAVHDLATLEVQPFPQDAPEVSLVLADDAMMADINSQWRNLPKPTNVLSFPAFPLVPGGKPGPMLGDIILARETIEREAGELGKPLDAHLAHLIIHGFLHLFGYDHIENNDAEKMEAIETRILASLGISDPYGDTEPV